jgi:hypothetical protein
MAHYAYIDENNTVTFVIVGPEEGTEPKDIASWEEYFSAQGQGQSLRTSYNTQGGLHYATDGEGNRVPSEDQSKALRKNYAGIGYTYDEERDAFIPPKPFESWLLNEDTCLWDAPVPYPTDGERYMWDEESGAWVEVEDDTV